MYQDKYNSNQLFSNFKFGIQRVYSELSQNNIAGLSLNDFNNNGNKISINEISFANLLKTDFNNTDTDKNQTVSIQEINTLLNSVDNKGLTYAQLQALSEQEGTSSGNSKSLLTTVIKNFNKIDTNKDGRVSQAEINAYKFNKEVEDKKKELCDFKASDISIFYDDAGSDTGTDAIDETSSVTTDSTSDIYDE